jgi:hypothetical protein
MALFVCPFTSTSEYDTDLFFQAVRRHLDLVARLRDGIVPAYAFFAYPGIPHKTPRIYIQHKPGCSGFYQYIPFGIGHLEIPKVE